MQINNTIRYYFSQIGLEQFHLKTHSVEATGIQQAHQIWVGGQNDPNPVKQFSKIYRNHKYIYLLT